MKKINKILVANRGEIALRIMKTCKRLGIATVAVYSEADQSAPFVKYADQSILIGPAPSAESYLKQDVIIDVAKKLDVDAIHRSEVVHVLLGTLQMVRESVHVLYSKHTNAGNFIILRHRGRRLGWTLQRMKFLQVKQDVLLPMRLQSQLNPLTQQCVGL